MRKELFWDCDTNKISPEIEIERAINFGGFEYIKEVQKKYGQARFIKVLMERRNLSKKAVNYWCLVLGIDRNLTAAFKYRHRVWSPLR
jgi:hypothetical protein